MADDLPTRIQRIQSKLAQARPQLVRWAADVLAFDPDAGVSDQPGPSLTEARLAAFERRHHVTLPADYRLFLREVGNGGPGAAYGLCRLKYCKGMELPFPFTAPWHHPDGLEAEPRAGHGTVFLADDGCGIGWYLVVTGPERGRVWVLGEGGADLCDPPRDFLAWYEAWLDSLLTGGDWYKAMLGPSHPCCADAPPGDPAMGEDVPF